MVALQFTVVDSNPVQFIPPNSRPNVSTVANLDSNNTIWINDKTSTFDAFPLAPGSSITWDANAALYAYVAVGSPATLCVLTNGGQVLSGTAVASALIKGGLAGQIAQATNALGIPNPDNLTLLYNQQLTTLGASIPMTGMSKWRSVYIVVTESAGDATHQWIRQNELLWIAPTVAGVGGPPTMVAEDFQSYCSSATGIPATLPYGSGSQVYVTQVKSDGLTLQIGSPVVLAANGSIPATQPLPNGGAVYVFGSYKDAPTKGNYLNDCGGLWGQSVSVNQVGRGIDGYISWTLNNPNTANTFAQPIPSKSGRAKIQIRALNNPLSATQYMHVYLMDNATRSIFLWTSGDLYGKTNSQYAILDDEVYLPNIPVSLRVDFAGGGTWPLVTVQMVFDT